MILSNLPKRIIPDANVLLDAAFISNGLARRSLTTLSSLGFTILIPRSIEDECRKILSANRNKLRLIYEPFELFLNFLDSINKIFIEESLNQVPNITKINKADRHVVSTAIHNKAFILTSDAPLLIEAKNIGIPAILPWDVIIEYETFNGKIEKLENFIRVTSLSQNTGSVFARVYAGSWYGQKINEKFTVVDIENVGVLYYDSLVQSWVFELTTGLKTSIKCPLTANGPWVVNANYNLPERNQLGKITLRVSLNSNSLQHSSSTTHKIRTARPGKISYGHDIHGRHYWNGTLRDIVISRNTVGQETWRALVQIETGAPNPFDSDSLELALKIVNSRIINSEQVRILEEDLLGL